MSSPAPKIISAFALLIILVPCLLYLTGTIDHDHVKVAALISTALWFVFTPLWMGHSAGQTDQTSTTESASTR